MNHSITNEILSLSIQHKGVEISSLKSLKTNTEYIWNADPGIWASSAPVLFPIIGALKDGRCKVDGEDYAIPKHGLIRHNEGLQLISQSNSHLEFQLSSSPETLKLYPYQFNFKIKYQLEGNSVIVSHLVKNTDQKDMHFALGGHPAFNCPFNRNEKYEDYFLEFAEEENSSRWMLNNEGLLSGEMLPYLKSIKKLPLQSDMFKDDALVFTDLKSKEVTLRSNKSQQSIRVSFSDFPFLGLWAKPNANFICIEPWQGLTDHAATKRDFKSKKGLIRLAVGEIYEAQYCISIEE